MKDGFFVGPRAPKGPGPEVHPPRHDQAKCFKMLQSYTIGGASLLHQVTHKCIHSNNHVRRGAIHGGSRGTPVTSTAPKWDKTPPNYTQLHVCWVPHDTSLQLWRSSIPTGARFHEPPKNRRFQYSKHVATPSTPTLQRTERFADSSARK